MRERTIDKLKERGAEQKMDIKRDRPLRIGENQTKHKAREALFYRLQQQLLPANIIWLASESTIKNRL